jgi:hypothetical protein
MNIIQTFVQLQQAFVTEGQRFTCVERASAEYTVQPAGYVALSGDVTFANGLVGALQINGNFVNSEFFGVLASNTADNAQKTIDALARLSSNKNTFVLPSGDISFEIPVGVIPEKIQIKGAGDGSTNLVFSDAVTSYRNVFVFSNSNITLSDLKITCTYLNASVFALNSDATANNITLNNVTVDGGILTQAEFLLRTATHGMLWNGSGKRLTVKNCTFKNLFFGLLKSSAATGDYNDVKFTKCSFYDNFNDHLEFNTPESTSSIKSIIISNNFFGDILGDRAVTGTDALLVGVAGRYENLVISGNTVDAQCSAAFHVEEGALSGACSITGNTINVRKGTHTSIDGRGIELFDNNVGGTDYSVRNITITGNSIKTEDGGRGFWVGTLANGATKSAVNYVFSSNVIDGFDTGIDLEFTSDNAVTNNIINGCTVGVSVQRPSLAIKNNLLSNCTTAFRIVSGNGCFGYNSFTNITTFASNIATGRSSIYGFDYTQEALTIPTGTNTINVFPITPHSVASNFLLTLIDTNIATGFAHAKYSMQRLNSGAITASNIIQSAVGGFTFASQLKDNSTALAIDVNNTNAESQFSVFLKCESLFTF